MKHFFWGLIPLFCLTACGYKGDLYLPTEDDPNQFGAIQTGWQWQQTPTKQPENFPIREKP